MSSTASESAASGSRSPKYRILVSFDLPPPTLELLRAHPAYPDAPVEVIHADNIQPNEIAQHLPIHGVIVRGGGLRMDAPTIERFGADLKVISTFSVGFDHIDVAAAKARGIYVGHCPNTVTHTTADTTLALLLSVARNIIPSHENVQKGEWGTLPWTCYELAGKDVHHATVGIVGLGRIGLAVAKRLRGFDCKILYTSRSPKPDAAKQVDAEYVSLDDLLARSDFVTIHCPLDDSTRKMVNAEFLSKMKRSAILINTTRGGIVDQDALYDALQSRRIWGAGLDVTDPEPLPKNHPLTTLENCLITPHIGTSTTDCRHETGAQTVKNVMEALTKEGGGEGIYVRG